MKLACSFVLVCMYATQLLAAAPTSTPNLPQPTRVTLHLDHVPARVAFARLYEQAHLSADQIMASEFDRMNDARVTLDMVDQPFLAALMEVCRQTRMEPSPGTSGQGYALRAVRPSKNATTAPSWVDFPGVVSGPFMFVPQRIYAPDGVDFSSSATDFCDLILVGMIDPSVGSPPFPSELSIDAAEDDQGRSLMPVYPLKPDAPLELGEVWMRLITARLKHPAPGATRIAHLVGHLEVSLVTKSQVLEFNDLKSPATTQTSDGLHVETEPLRRDEIGGLFFTVKFLRNREGHTWHEFMLLVQDGRNFHFEDINGIPLASTMNGGGSDARSDFTSRRIVSILSKGHRLPSTRPARITLTIPQKVEHMSIPVEFHDLPLP